MSNPQKVVINANKGESLTRLYRQIIRKFPALEENISITEGRKPFFGAGEPVVKRIIAIINPDKITLNSTQILEEIEKMANALGKDNVKVILEEEQKS